MISMTRCTATFASAAVLGLGLAACGESEEEKAKKAVCNATADIKEDVTSLSNLTLSSGAVDQVQKSLQAIQSDVKTISDNVDELAGEFKSQVQQANESFSNAVDSVAGSLGSDLTLSGAESQIKTAVSSLGSAYTQAFASVKC